MSWDVHLEADLGGPAPLRVGDLDANYTWNVHPMFQAAIGEEGFCNAWDGLSASVAVERCTRILAAFEAEPDRFIALNPANGWGDFDGARRFVQTIHDACAEAPHATLRVG